MRYVLSAIMAAGWFCLAMAALAQTNTPSPSAAPAAPAAKSDSTANPASGGKRGDCLVAVQGKKGQDRQDGMQLCMAQGRVDCLKQAVDQKVVGPQRKEFVKNCMKEE